MENDPKDSKVITMPDINGEELASAVARALRTSSPKGSGQKSVLDDERRSVVSLAEKDGEGTSEANKPLRAKVEVLSSPVDEIDNSYPEPIQNLSLKASSDKESSIKQVPVTLIQESPYQTRTNFDEVELKDLSLSIQQKGILQPLIVRKIKGENESAPYELIAGERRLRASKLAGLEVVPVIEKEMTNKEALEASIVENAQRQDLNPVEEARAFKLLSTEFKLSQTKIAEATSKSRETVANSLRLLQLTEPVLELLEEGNLTSGHGKILASLDEKEQIYYSRKILVNSLSVRGLEKLIQKRESSQEGGSESSSSLSDKETQKLKASLRRFENKIAELTKIEEEQVRLTVDTQGRKRVGITFDTEASFKRFMSKLRG